MIAWIVISAGIAYFLSLPFASLLQGANYSPKTYFHRAIRPIVICLIDCCIIIVLSLLVFLFCRGILRGLLWALLYVVDGVFTLWLHRKMRMRLTVTNRLARLLIVTVLVYIILYFPFYFASLSFLWTAFPATAPFVLIFSELIVVPFEKKNNARYLRKAKKALAETQAIKIGITGSYGKTGVKSALEQLLSVQYRTLATPANYNTPLGIAKTMELSDGEEEILILEMGARRTGDIQELCDIVSPTIGIITGIAPQHLETFGSIQSILEEKNTLSLAVPSESVVYFNVADERVRGLYEKRVGEKVGVGYENADRLILDPIVTENGTEFLLKSGDRSIRVEIPLYGKAAITDVAVAFAVALDLGVSSELLCERAKRIRPAPHRFEVMKKGSVTIIDDSYNINPIGAAAALDSLSLFPAKRRIVYVSGIVELGNETVKENLMLGKNIAETCSFAIVANGRYGDLVVQGLLAEKPSFPILRVSDTTEATASFRKLLKEEDLLLIMSDLPRDYLL